MIGRRRLGRIHRAISPSTSQGLLRLAPDEHLLLVTMHHIISDGWSIGLLLEEVRSGQQRIVSRPRGIDADLEGLAVQALARILGEMRPDS